jgi:tetratricopeptide (TPR) repeat protein
VDPAAARAHYAKATRLYEVGEYQQALAEFKAAHLAKPDSAFLYNIAQCHRQMGDLGQAVVMYKRYLVATPNAANRPEVDSTGQCTGRNEPERSVAASRAGTSG